MVKTTALISGHGLLLLGTAVSDPASYKIIRFFLETSGNLDARHKYPLVLICISINNTLLTEAFTKIKLSNNKPPLAL